MWVEHEGEKSRMLLFVINTPFSQNEEAPQLRHIYRRVSYE